MTFSEQWDKLYRDNRHMSVWPWSDLVSYVCNHVPAPEGARALELGCGAGANIPFLLSRGFDYHGIDGSEYIINLLKEKFPGLENKLITGDFTDKIPFEGNFSLIVDRGAITQNPAGSVRKVLELIKAQMSKDSVFIGIDWFSTAHSGFAEGIPDKDDPFTCREFKSGYFKDLGITHFSDKEHLLDLFGDFNIIALDHKVVTSEITENKNIVATWNIAAVLKND